jgi:hypothetical protein
MKLLCDWYHGLFWGSLLLLLAAMAGCRGAEGPAPTPPPAEQEQAATVAPEEPVAIAPEPAVAPAPAPEEPPAASPSTTPEMESMASPAPDTEPAVPDAPPAAEEEPEEMATEFPKPAEVDDTWQMPEPEPWNLGPPLVENVDGLKPLDPKKPVWIDMENKRIVLVGKVCQREVPLELFACLRHTKEHEAITVFDVKALSVHAGLLAVGAEVGNPVQFNPEYVPARGTEIEVTVRWKDADGKVQTARAQDWIQNTETEKAMTENWVFAGSGFWVEGGQKTYQAEGGDFICVANFATAMLDIPVESSQANQMLTYRAFTERIPPLETPVTLLLTPKPAANKSE